MCSGNNPDCMCQEYDGASIAIWMPAIVAPIAAKALSIASHDGIHDVDIMFDGDQGQVNVTVGTIVAKDTAEAWEVLDEIADYVINDVLSEFGKDKIHDWDVDASWGAPYPSVVTSGGRDVS